MKAYNMKNSSGIGIKNQFIIVDTTIELSFTKNNKEYRGNFTGNMFQSYSSNIAFIDYSGKVFLDSEKWDYSKTTGKYRNVFLSETKKETEKKIASGEYILTDLNN